MFYDRVDAGKKLTDELVQFKDQANTVVVGLPRGGVPVAYQISKELNLPLDIICPRKIGAPGHKEFAIGAITETGEGIFNLDVINRMEIPQSYIDEEVEKEKAEALYRLNSYRKGLPARDFRGKTVIIVDDGLATGSTMKAAIRSIKSEGASQIIVAVPVSPPDTFRKINEMVDELICLETPPFFQAVGQFYSDFRPTDDEEVISLMKRANNE